MKKINYLPVVVLSALFVTSCEKDIPENPVIPNEEEVITTLHYTLTPVGGGSPVVFTFRDMDGDGGEVPVIIGGTLDTNTFYTGTLELLNEQENPAEDITQEILAEAEDHQFFYQTAISGLEITYGDSDANGHPVGLATNVQTQGQGFGTITIILRHEPDKNAQGVQDGDVSNAGGETDIEVTFDVEIP